jgi:hypothetical protein
MNYPPDADLPEEYTRGIELLLMAAVAQNRILDIICGGWVVCIPIYYALQ